MSSIASPACMSCRHFRLGSGKINCDAFPDQIPDLIWLQGDKHTGPVDGDHGIRYEQGKPQGEDRRK